MSDVNINLPKLAKKNIQEHNRNVQENRTVYVKIPEVVSVHLEVVFSSR